MIDRHHSKGPERTPPHRIENRANVYAAVSCNPDAILSVNSVGSFSENCLPVCRGGIRHSRSVHKALDIS